MKYNFKLSMSGSFYLPKPRFYGDKKNIRFQLVKYNKAVKAWMKYVGLQIAPKAKEAISIMLRNNKIPVLTKRPFKYKVKVKKV